MAHQEQNNFVKRVKNTFPSMFSGKRVLEVGSFNVNGTVRDQFEGCDYLGIDVSPGPCVDLVCPGQDFKDEKGFDTIITCEMMEHNPYWRETLLNIVDLLHPQGLLVLTCASTGRPEHGTIRTSPGNSPSSSLFGDYYMNLTESDFRSVVDMDATFVTYGFELEPRTCDIYLWGVKR